MLHRGGQSQKWPTSGQLGFITLAVSGLPNASEREGGRGSQVAYTRVTRNSEGILSLRYSLPV